LPPDAAFVKPDIYETLEERGAKYAIRVPASYCLLPAENPPLFPWRTLSWS
jgi:hypothetical protein